MSKHARVYKAFSMLTAVVVLAWCLYMQSLASTANEIIIRVERVESGLDSQDKKLKELESPIESAESKVEKIEKQLEDIMILLKHSNSITPS
mgnify:FL=1